MALQFGVGNAGATLQILAVSLCPVPSRAQHCELAPRQTSQTAEAALLRGDARVTAVDQSTGQEAFGIIRAVQSRAPTHRAALEPDPKNGQSANHREVTAEAYFWATNSSDAPMVTVEYVVVHSAAWFDAADMVRAVAMHRTSGDNRPGRDNLVAMMYCNADAPTPGGGGGVVDCGEWGARDLPLDASRPTTLANFSSTRSVSPRSIAYQSLQPLTGGFLLTPKEYEEFDQGMAGMH